MCSRHTVVPKVDNYQDIFNSHLLKLWEQLFSAAFFVSIIIALNDSISRHAGVQTSLTLTLALSMIALLLTQPVGNNTCLGFPDLLSSGNEVHDKVHMHLFTDCCGECLVRNTLLYWLFSETDWVYNTFHFAEFFLCYVLLLASDVFIILVVIIDAWVTRLILIIGFNCESVFFGVISTELEHKISLLISRSITLSVR